MRRLVVFALLAVLATPVAAIAQQPPPQHRYRQHPEQRLPYSNSAIPLFKNPRISSHPLPVRTLDAWRAMWARELGRTDFNDQLDASASYFH
jgi:hypothetical protein